MTRFKKIVAPLVAGLSLATAMPASAAEFVTNSGFETGNFFGWAKGGNTNFTNVTAGAANANVFGARLNGVSVFLLQDSSALPSASQTFSGFQSRAASDAGTPQFAFSQDPGFWNLDNVSVQNLASVVPETTTWALLLFGFAVAGLSMRARSRRVTSGVSFV